MLGHAPHPAPERRASRPADVAGPGSRFCAAAIDTVIGAAAMLVVAGTFAPRACATLATTDRGGSGPEPLPIILVAAATFLYQGLSETFVGGRTLGKRVMGLRARSAGGEPLAKGQAIVRNLLRAVDFLPLGYVVGGLLSLFGPASQRLGDLVAKTIVVRERPPHLPQMAPSEPISILTPDEAALVLGFLERRAALSGAARARVAEDIAARLYKRHGGDWVSAESYLERLAAGTHRPTDRDSE